MAPPADSTLTFGNDDAARSRTEQLLGAAHAKLASVDRTKLRGSDATTYDQASGFIIAAQQAIVQQDYVAASGFAEKASLLAAKVAASGH
jgi:hypothetical protein